MRYAHPLDNLLRTATVTLQTGTVMTGYEVENVYSGVWHRGVRVEEDDIDIMAEFGAGVSPVLAVIGNSNLTVAARLQGHASSGFGGGSPTVDLPFEVPVLHKSGFFSSVWLAPTGLPSLTHWRLHVVGNDYPVVVGQFFLIGVERGLPGTYILRAYQPADEGASEINITPAGVTLAYERSTPIARIDGSFIVNGSGLQALMELAYAAHFAARHFLMIPDTDVNDAWLVRMAQDSLPYEKIKTGAQTGNYQVPFPVRMSARGMSHVDPDTL